jgi:methylenetetrahydrofolate--tRNA-(uracil-5-)-methyltransferase
MNNKVINVIGAGLAGSEAAYQIAKRGYKVNLYEMRPKVTTGAHHTDKFAELVCSNSLKSNLITKASGLLKEEMRLLDSLIIKCADLTAVPAGQSLSVDREKFSSLITDTIKSNPLIKVINKEVTTLPDGINIIATGPLTSKKLTKELSSLLIDDSLYFYDAAAPLIDASSIDFTKTYKKSRYDKGGDDYINCPFTKEEFFKFYNELINAKTFPLREFEKGIFFESCKPIEVIAKSGYKSLLFGPMRPVGLNKEDGTRPYAVVQLRQDDSIASIYNIVGFQTNLMQPEQKRVFSLIPGLEKMKIIRYGMMHKNTYINAPKNLYNTMLLKSASNVFIAGQLSGVEGYVESSASAILAAINAVKLLEGKKLVSLPINTQIGSLIKYITNKENNHFKPMNANYGIMNLDIKDKEKAASISLESLKKWIEKNE